MANNFFGFRLNRFESNEMFLFEVASLLQEGDKVGQRLKLVERRNRVVVGLFRPLRHHHGRRGVERPAGQARSQGRGLIFWHADEGREVAKADAGVRATDQGDEAVAASVWNHQFEKLGGSWNLLGGGGNSFEGV